MVRGSRLGDRRQTFTNPQIKLEFCFEFLEQARLSTGQKEQFRFHVKQLREESNALPDVLRDIDGSSSRVLGTHDESQSVSLHDTGSHLKILQPEIEVVGVKVHFRKHQERLSEQNRVLFFFDGRERLYGHVDVDRLKEEQDEVAFELLEEVATPNVGVVDEEGVDCTALHVSVDEGLPLVFANHEPHRQPVIVKNNTAEIPDIRQPCRSAVQGRTYKAKLRSSRDTSDTALKKEPGGTLLRFTNAATNGCSFDKGVGTTHERSLGRSCGVSEVEWISAVEEASTGRISRRWTFSLVLACFFLVSSYAHSSDFPERRQ